jgi:hypothetical protein
MPCVSRTPAGKFTCVKKVSVPNAVNVAYWPVPTKPACSQNVRCEGKT